MAKKCMGKCALCRQNDKELQLSHIVPSFVGRKMLKTSPGLLRSTNEPNKAINDTEKHFMLCHDCEELFSAKERWFANNIFNPFQDNNKKRFEYNENLTYFIISLSWRSLYLDLEEFSRDKTINRDILLNLYRSEGIMREYLLGKRQNLENIQNHIFFFDKVQSGNNINLDMNPTEAMLRSICSYSVNGDTSFTVSNLMGILIVTFYSMETNEKWINTKIEPLSGIIEAQGQKFDSVVGYEIVNWMELAEQAKNSLSEKQKAKIEAKIKALGDDIKKYPFYQNWLNDQKLKHKLK